MKAPARRSGHGSYVYCLIAARTRPRPRAAAKRLPGAGALRLVEVRPRAERGAERTGRGRGLRQWLAMADVPLDRYGDGAIEGQLSDIDWVARVAVAHEAAVESFDTATAVLPMKLFTIYASDERAVDDIAGKSGRVWALIERVANHHEWGVRVQLGRMPSQSSTIRRRTARGGMSGTSYLSEKKAEKDAEAELALRASDVVSTLYDQLSRCAAAARLRSGKEVPPEGTLLLDAAFLVANRRAERFRRVVEKNARLLARDGYRLRLTGPWPAYSFMQD